MIMYSCKDILTFFVMLIYEQTIFVYPEWQHRLGGCLACGNPGFDSWADRGNLYALCVGGAQGVLPCEGWG